jgi:hypothetical protein
MNIIAIQYNSYGIFKLCLPGSVERKSVLLKYFKFMTKLNISGTPHISEMRVLVSWGLSVHNE